MARRGIRVIGVDVGIASVRLLALPAPAAAPGRLTPAERAVVSLALQGHSNQEIARRRKRAARTVSNQLGSACRKLGVSGRAELVRLGRRK